MILAFHPTHPEMPGQEQPVPGSLLRYLSPWSKPICKQNDFGVTLIQEFITQEFGIFIWTLEIEKVICLYPRAKIPTIALQFTIEGNISCILNGFGDKLLEKGNSEMFYVPIGYNEAWYKPGLSESLHIELQPAYLEELIAIRPEIGELISRLLNASIKGMPMGMAHANYKTHAILQNLRTCDIQGASLQLEMHKFILELLSEYFKDVQQNEKDEAAENTRHKKLMVKIKNHILLAPNIHEHTLDKLAKLFGISESLLKRSFKNHYHITVSEFVYNHVMSKGHYLLTTTSKSINDIAEELGYTWQVSFEQAFKKFFNYSPAGLRKDPKS
jgi:AraC-like DNA-binding protein